MNIFNKVFFGVCAAVLSMGCDLIEGGSPNSPTPIKDPPPFHGEVAHIAIPGVGEQMEWRFETGLQVGGKYENSVIIRQWCSATRGLVWSITVRGTALDDQGNVLPGPIWDMPEAKALNWYVDGERGEVCHYPGGGNTKFTTEINLRRNDRVSSMKYEVWLNEPDLYREPDPKPIQVPKFPIRSPDYEVTKYYGWERQ